MTSNDLTLQDLIAHDRWIRALARRLVSDDAAAEDLAQEAWLAAVERPPTKTGLTRAWLARVARNLNATRLRSDSSRSRREEVVARTERLLSTEELWEQEQTRRRVALAVFALEEPYRAAILHRYFQDLPPREIAEELSVSIAAVEGRLRRGLQKLRARLDRDFGDRMTWCAALLPLTGLTAGEATSATAATAGALIMGMKIKIGIAAVVAIGVAYAFWPPTSNVGPSRVQEANLAQPVAPAAKKAAEAKPSTTEEPEAIAKAGATWREVASEAHGPQHDDQATAPNSFVGMLPIPAGLYYSATTPAELDEYLESFGGDKRRRQ